MNGYQIKFQEKSLGIIYLVIIAQRCKKGENEHYISFTVCCTS